MISISVDEKQLNRSLKKAAQLFGDTTRQGVARMAVATSRGLAGSTQPFGRNAKKTRDLMHNAIWKDTWSVVTKVEMAPKRGGKMYFASPRQLFDFVESMRTRRRGRTPRGLPPGKKGKATHETIKRQVAMRQKLAGIAKGGWLDAGKAAARFQSGGKRLNLGKNFLGWAQRSGAGYGSAKQSGPQWRPTIELNHKAGHVKSPHVLNPSRIPREARMAANMTLKWYNRAAKRALDKA